LISDLSRRDCRTQPGVLTPGNDKNLTRPEGAEDIRLVIRAPADRLETTLFRPFRARPFWAANPGLKPRAESCRPFGTKFWETDWTLRPVHQIPVHSDGPKIVQTHILVST
jgi:hypothetical protein